mmetsp:Transcript_23330/g.47167  ORF Transcript_23330/g.47167 Transcript_23330/m.47167 type:complete len:280 (-) Transcript_23330:441-1280(-)|eukprot:CAMPEP_0181316846 /NCGR_PEP_ID=MMETSP1101-20121128/16113_1 /TAXON_ID=46948 /ORGANISM="Rhodomonas abbreviata, Strain Caron Lab Isolate" /LENGTH=279 /DNA_ID=CAMNT_0023424121 /DNA_START=151 /DNA_END=990 /DNA_ORIENTATION=+
MSSIVHFKFRNSLMSDVVHFCGDVVSLKELTLLVARKKGLEKALRADTALVFHTQCGEELADTNQLIPKNSFVHVQRKKVLKAQRQVTLPKHYAGIPVSQGKSSSENSVDQFERAIRTARQTPAPSTENGLIPKELQCALTKGLLLDPVILPCCQAKVCRSSVHQTLKDSETCPVCLQTDVTPSCLLPLPRVQDRAREFVRSTHNAPVEQSFKLDCPTCTDETGRLGTAKRSAAELEDDFYDPERAQKKRKKDNWDFHCTSEFQKRSAERFLRIYSAQV